MPRRYFVYILANARRTVLYTGVTNDLRRRVEEHRSGEGTGFTRRYNATDLVYFEEYGDVNEAIAREKQVKGGSRQKKVVLVESLNPDWRDLADDLALL